MKCLICNHESPNFRGLGNHIKKAHKIDRKDYYDKYLKKDNEDICPVCGKFNKFINLNIGYSRTCSVSCGQKHIFYIEKYQFIKTNYLSFHQIR